MHLLAGRSVEDTAAHTGFSAARLRSLQSALELLLAGHTVESAARATGESPAILGPLCRMSKVASARRALAQDFRAAVAAAATGAE